MITLIATPERRISGSPNDRRISPAIAEFSAMEAQRLRELNKELVIALLGMIASCSRNDPTFQIQALRTAQDAIIKADKFVLARAAEGGKP